MFELKLSGIQKMVQLFQKIIPRYKIDKIEFCHCLKKIIIRSFWAQKNA